VNRTVAPRAFRPAFSLATLALALAALLAPSRALATRESSIVAQASRACALAHADASARATERAPGCAGLRPAPDPAACRVLASMREVSELQTSLAVVEPEFDLWAGYPPKFFALLDGPNNTLHIEASSRQDSSASDPQTCSPENSSVHASAESIEPQPFEIFTGLSLLAPETAPAFKPSVPKNRIWVFSVLGSTLIGVKTAESYSWHWGFETLNLGIASELVQGAWTDPATGLAYHRARWYDPRNGVWLSEDPEGNVDSENLYAFVGWRPHSGTDPLGLGEELIYGDPVFEDHSPEAVAARLEVARLGGHVLKGAVLAVPRFIGFAYNFFRHPTETGDWSKRLADRLFQDPVAFGFDTARAISQLPSEQIAEGLGDIIGTAGLGAAMKSAKAAAFLEAFETRIRALRTAAIAADDLKAANALGRAATIVEAAVEAPMAAAPAKTIPKRLQYLGRTPGKASRTGRAVIDRMKIEGKLVAGADGKLHLIQDGGSMIPLTGTDMGHLEDAVKYWNRQGYTLGEKSEAVRKWMLDPTNYELQPAGPNRSKGAQLLDRYRPPLGD